MKGSLPKCSVFQKHMVDDFHAIFSKSPHAFYLVPAFIFQIIALATPKNIILSAITLQNLKLKKKNHLTRARCFKASVFLSVLRNTRKSYRPICQVLIVLQTETKSKFCPVLNFGNVLCLVNLIPLVSVSTSVSDLRSLLPECSPCPSLSV